MADHIIPATLAAEPSRNWRVLAIFALLSGIAQLSILGKILDPVLRSVHALLYGNAGWGLVVFVLGTFVPTIIWTGWFVSGIRLWKQQRNGLWVFRLLCLISLVRWSILLRNWYGNNFDYVEEAAARHVDLHTVVVDHANERVELNALIMIYAVVVLYSMVVSRTPTPTASAQITRRNAD